jgi:hypothetical protein
VGAGAISGAPGTSMTFQGGLTVALGGALAGRATVSTTNLVLQDRGALARCAGTVTVTRVLDVQTSTSLPQDLDLVLGPGAVVLATQPLRSVASGAATTLTARGNLTTSSGVVLGGPIPSGYTALAGWRPGRARVEVALGGLLLVAPELRVSSMVEVDVRGACVFTAPGTVYVDGALGTGPGGRAVVALAGATNLRGAGLVYNHGSLALNPDPGSPVYRGPTALQVYVRFLQGPTGRLEITGAWWVPEWVLWLCSYVGVLWFFFRPTLPLRPPSPSAHFPLRQSSLLPSRTRDGHRDPASALNH